MSRWEALNSESSKSSTSFRKGGGGRAKYSAGWSGNRSQSKQDQRLNGQSVPSDAILFVLRQQLSSYKSDSDGDGYRSSVVLENLHDFHDSCRNSPNKQVKPDSFLLLVDLLYIEASEVFQSVARIMEYLLEEKSITVSKAEALECITKLSKQCQKCPSNSVIQTALSLLVLSQAHKLPAEDVAQSILAPLLLPSLESSLTTPKVFNVVCQTLSGLLRHHNHASAILAPLVEDIAPDGKEKKIFNPLRIRLFSALTLSLSAESNDISQKKSSACYTLADAITASIKVDGNLSTSVTKTDLNISILNGFFLKSLQSPHDSLYVPSVVLLRSILRRGASGSTSGVGSQVLLELLSNIIFEPTRTSAVKHKRCSLCSTRGDEVGQFLSVVHVGQTEASRLDTKTVNLATDCLAEILQVLPWKLWLQRGKSDNRNAMSGFRRKLIDFLLGLTTISRCAFLRCDEASVSPTCHLLKSCFWATQVEDENLVQLSINLWSTLAKSSLSTTSTKVREELVELLVESTGGRVTPNGEILSMYTPARIWLLSSPAESFLNDLFGAAKSTSHHSHHAIKLLSSIFRTCPQIAYTDALAKFRTLFNVGDTGEAGLARLVLLEAFILGRKDFGDSSETGTTTREVALIASSNLEKSLLKTNNQCQCLSLSIFGALLVQDWEVLDEDDGQLPKHWEAVLSLCKSKNTKVRTAACKSIGDFCTHYVPLVAKKSRGEGNELNRISNSICTSMQVALSDDKALVRSMAMFSLGNLAHSLRTNDCKSLEVPLIIGTCAKIQFAMHDSNNKVSGNSIRSAGHWGYLLARTDQGNMTPEAIRILGKIVDDLSGKLSNTLESLSYSKKETLTWKQRSAAKKHGWGACHSLACIFKGLSVLDNSVLTSSCSEGVRQLILCMEKFYFLNEKIALSAMAAVCDLDTQHLAELSGKSGILGEAVATCINRLYEYDSQSLTVSQKQILETERCLRKILPASSILDASVALKITDWSQSILSFLYTWMVDKDLEGSAFEIFALALQRRGLMSSNVSLEQSFASRSLQQYKKNQLLSPDDLEHDDGAEL